MERQLLKQLKKKRLKPLTNPLSICYTYIKSLKLTTLFSKKKVDPIMHKYIVKFEQYDVKYEIECKTYEEMLEQCLNVFNQNGQPLQVLKDGEHILATPEIYKLIGRYYN